MKFISIFLLSSALLFSSLYGFILSVDPYNKYGFNPFGFETKAVDFARENKFNQIQYRDKKYEAFIIGSSTAHRYETKILKECTGLASYNYATQSATPEDFLAITRHILQTNKPKLFFLVLDFEQLNKNIKTDDMFFSSPLSRFLNSTEVQVDEKFLKDAYLSLEALGDSFKVVWVNLFGKAEHAYLEDGDHRREPYSPGPVEVNQFNYPNYVLSEKRIEMLREIKKLSDENHFRLVVITAPYSIEHINRINQDTHLKVQLDKFKSILKETFDEVYDFDVPEIAPFSDRHHFGNSNHPNHDFSNEILKHIFCQRHESWPEALGKRL
ncbi:MAG: hypothetical protein K2P81_16500 [Bacteriovoracaceae bacterium]|nr:hypothetical protein [Bacteriovoracaceae bacterium]